MNIYQLIETKAPEFWVRDIKWGSTPQKMDLAELVLQLEDECFHLNVFSYNNTRFALSAEELED